MTFRRNSGKFRHKIILQKPKPEEYDELGGLVSSGFDDFCTVFAMCEQRSQSRQQVVGDYVTVDTRYFVVKDVSRLSRDIDTSWQIVYNGHTFRINQVELLNESVPYYVQFTATAINGGGGII